MKTAIYMPSVDTILEHANEIENKLHYRFRNRNLLVLAFIHRSFINENREFTQHNERLEFLGDSVLGMIAAEYLYTILPDMPEGELSFLRSRLVEASSCIRYIQKLDVSHHLLLGKGERRNDGRGRESILSDLFEALIGAIFVDGGVEAAKKFLFYNFSEEIDEIVRMPVRNWKAMLQDYCQKRYQQAPYYVVITESGPDHSKLFTVNAIIHGEVMGEGKGASKKEAQQAAAADAFSKMQPEEP